MKSFFVDTNYFLRFLIKDIPTQFEEVNKLFEKAALREVYLFSSSVVIFEVYWVLKSNFGKDKNTIVEFLSELLTFNVVKFEHGELLKESLTMFKNENVSLVDAFFVCYARYCDAEEFASFDHKLLSLWKRVK
ncbi:hypothetical protein A3D77_05245 [Candidatus Gottesmanbacteria bacterium RIFCSPHIGHO2_02_FULL_39_11]|uniref:PIN domain-containing protein n=1 Tax=Candidatus Gottesmanbacteria bacterium RIFCSPHIGHO2_02_FULL_39_11 TaxID=1798382 RepID=A0A1F5ZP97_9BACT|nr:MAG: hypothetical protein A3D77_05245 [Candidatus Gottesmanbacteria bacterium RIFCSPHIGHO2_02_FULL_39_11]